MEQEKLKGGMAMSQGNGSKVERVTIGVSFPKREESHKTVEALRGLAERNSRTLSNQIVVILNEFVRKEGLS